MKIQNHPLSSITDIFDWLYNSNKLIILFLTDPGIGLYAAHQHRHYRPKNLSNLKNLTGFKLISLYVNNGQANRVWQSF